MGSATSEGRFPAKAEDMDHSTAHCAILIVMMSWEAGSVRELNWESDVVQSPHAGLIFIYL